jgi:hypothetical protein
MQARGIAVNNGRDEAAAAAERIRRRDEVAAAAIESIGRRISSLDNEWDDGSDNPSVLTVRRGERDGYYNMTVDFDDGSKATAVIYIALVGTEPGERGQP